MQRQLHTPLLAGVAAALVALASCNALFGIESGSLAVGGGATTISGDGGPGGEGGPDGGGFPATPVLDDFNRADGTLGPNWSVDTPGGFQISGDQLLANTGTPGIMVWSTVFGPTQEAFITVVSFDPGDGEIELILKNQGMIMECDSIEVDYQPNGMGPGMGMLGIYACANGTPGTYGTAPFTLAPGDQFGARARADGKVEVYKNGKMVNTFDVSPFMYATSGGRIGYFSSSLVAPARLDDFGGGTTP
jgi:hypothetical protein